MTAFLRGVRAFLTTRPVIGLGLVFLGFLLSVIWLLEGILETGWLGGKAAQWLEPASLVATTLGAAIIAATLISRRSLDTLRVAHGLAAGYFFNFVKPTCDALADPQNGVHAQTSVVGLIVAIPDSADGIERESLNRVARMDGPEGLENRLQGFAVSEVSIESGASRKARAKLVVNAATGKGVLVDVPTTLSVIAEHADYLCKHGAEGLDDEYAREARMKDLKVQGNEEFRRQVYDRGHREFSNELVEVGATASSRSLPYPPLHIVVLSKLKQRAAELIGSA